jgi:hypothetical protein
MNNPKEKTALVPSPVRRRKARRILLAALLAVLGAAAAYKGIGSPSASAAPQSAPPSGAMTPTTEQSLPAYPANADTDFGPGQIEPMLVRTP